MPLPRKYQKIFGGNLTATPNGNLGVPGSAALGAETYSADLAVIQSSAWLDGWAAVIVGTNSPVKQEFTSILFQITQQLAYLFEVGIPEWDSQTEYSEGSLAQAGFDAIYVSKQDNNVGHPLSDTNWWGPFGENLFDPLGAAAQAKSDAEEYTNVKIAQAIAALPPQIAQAAVVFNGATCAIISEFNVASVDRTGFSAAGQYRITFASPINHEFPYWTGSVGSDGRNLPGCLDSVVGLDPANINRVFVGLYNQRLQIFEDGDLVTIIVF